MGRLRVGDIEIDEHGVRFGGAPAGTGATGQSLVRVEAGAALDRPSGTASAPRPRDGLEVLQALPIRPQFLVGCGLVLAAAGGVSLVLAPPSDPVSMVLRGGILFSTGMGVVALGAIKAVLKKRGGLRRRLEREARLAPVIERLRGVLQLEDAVKETEQTVERIVQRSGLPEADVVRGLVLLRDREEVREELDPENGHWYYQLIAREAPEKPRDLDSRLAELERSGRQ